MNKLFCPIILTAILVFAGCTTTSKMAKPLNDFSSATSDVNTVTVSALTTIVQAVDQDSQAIEMSQSTPTPPPSLREGMVHPILEPNDLLERQLVLEALSTYATTLKTVAGVDRSTDIQKSFDSLKTSLESTVGNISKLSSNSTMPVPSGVVSGLVALSANLAVAYAAHEREEAIRRALHANNSTVAKICGLLAAELGPRGPIYKQLENDFRLQEEAADKKYKAALPSSTSETTKVSGDAKSAPEGKPSPQATPDLVPFYKGFAALKARKDYSLALLDSLATSYRKIAESHRALAVQSANGAKSDAQLSALSAEIDRVKFFSSQIPK